MNRISWLLPAAALAATGACAVTEPSETRAFSLSGFDSIEATGGVNLVLKQGPYAISAKGPKSKLDRLVIEQQGSTLSITREANWNWWYNYSETDIVTITAPSYTRIEADGGVDIEAHGLAQPSLTLDTTGGADFDANNFRIDALHVTANGGADVNLSGACKTLTLEMSGGADFDSENFACETATINASGGSDVNVRASLSASARATSGADINVFGTPAAFTSDKDSGGDIELRAP